MRIGSTPRGFIGVSVAIAMCIGCGGDQSGHPFGVSTSCDTQLTATVLARRQTSVQLSWTAPVGVASYAVRYAKVPISFSNFDDSSVTTAVSYSGTPAAAGTADQITVSNLYIENDYYFAVAAKNSAGSYTWLQTTASATTAHFNRTVFVSSSGTNEQLGYSVSADGDLNGDGLSDMLVGTYNSGKAYLYLGSGTLSGGSASVVFSGAHTAFGMAVSQIGDIDNDGHPDIAIAEVTGTPAIYIFKGRTSWPSTLSDSQADYTVTGDSTYSNSLWASVTRLGDFTGDGIDDFAFGARGFSIGGVASVGCVVIIPGKSSGFASVALPDPSSSIVISGDTTLGRPFFGYRVLGLGHFYTASTGTTLIVSAPGLSSNATSNAGRVYAFHGQTGSSGVIAASSADQVIVGPAPGARIGLSLANLGPLLGTLPAVGVGNPADNVDVSGINGTGYVLSGTASAGPLTNKVILTLGGAAGGGGFMVGGGTAGRDTTLSLIGDGTVDLVFGAEQSSVLTILDGAKLASRTSPVETTANAEVEISLPSGWTTGENAANILPDVDGDGFADFCIGNAFGSVPGAVAVYW